MSLSLGASRVDVCVINGSLSGYEIKSPRDNLDRLPSQVEHYGRVLDRATIVTSEKQLDRVSIRVPAWWGVWCATAEDAGVTLHPVRAAMGNPGLDPESVAQLLCRDEAFDELRLRGLHHGLSNATRWTLWDLLLERLSMPELQTVVRARLKARLPRRVA